MGNKEYRLQFCSKAKVALLVSLNVLLLPWARLATPLLVLEVDKREKYQYHMSEPCSHMQAQELVPMDCSAEPGPLCSCSNKRTR